jgi:hypothetical protein
MSGFIVYKLLNFLRNVAEARNSSLYQSLLHLFTPFLYKFIITHKIIIKQTQNIFPYADAYLILDFLIKEVE